MAMLRECLESNVDQPYARQTPKACIISPILGLLLTFPFNTHIYKSPFSFFFAAVAIFHVITVVMMTSNTDLVAVFTHLVVVFADNHLLSLWCSHTMDCNVLRLPSACEVMPGI